uniref:FBA_2 domain-containing protein n=1 Tax=Caenorhabditis tropicalis TaxID=1561998 RepID=A0A1I7UU27_9PELO
MLKRAKTLHQREIELIIKVSEEPLKDIMKWFDYAREVLHCKINSVLLDLGCWTNENSQTSDWIATQNRTIDKMSIWNYNEESDDDLKYLMERIHASGNLSLSVRKHKDDFRMEIPGKPERLHIDYSEFIDYNQLLRLKSPVINLQQSILTSQEINRFLKSWMSCATHLELEAFKISISGPNAMNQIMKLPHEKTNDPKIADAFKGRPFNLQVVNEMFTIKRSDGKKHATVTVENLWGVWSFYLIVH